MTAMVEVLVNGRWPVVMPDMASRARLAVTAVDRGAVFPEWVWLTMETTT